MLQCSVLLRHHLGIWWLLSNLISVQDFKVFVFVLFYFVLVERKADLFKILAFRKKAASCPKAISSFLAWPKMFYRHTRRDRTKEKGAGQEISWALRLEDRKKCFPSLVCFRDKDVSVSVVGVDPNAKL